MASIPKVVTESIKELLPDNFTQEDLKKALQSIYNAGYRMGLKARPPRQDLGPTD